MDYLPAPRLEASVVPRSPSEISNPSPRESEAVWPPKADRPEFKSWSCHLLAMWPWGGLWNPCVPVAPLQAWDDNHVLPGSHEG